jgi:hypothetical protein
MIKALITILIAVFFAAQAGACSVPVFRYALERWQADSYTVVIAHDKPLSPAQQTSIDSISTASNNEYGFANLFTIVVDLQTETNAPALKYIPETHPTYPAMFLFYPRSFGEPTIIWQDELTDDNAKRIIESKLRKEIEAQILRGRSTTWILVESGDNEQDDIAYNQLKTSLEDIRKEADLPGGVATPDGEVTGDPEYASHPVDPINQLQSSIPLQISFSIIRLSKDNKDEAVLRSMLMNIEQDLFELSDKPMAFPVFGRGRVLEPLIGDGISEDNITGMSVYLLGACSCEVKMQNPGLDLLFNVDWESWLKGNSMIEDRVLPPLSGIADIVGEKPTAAAEAKTSDEPDTLEDTTESAIGRNIGIASVIIFMIITVVSTVMLKRKS